MDTCGVGASWAGLAWNLAQVVPSVQTDRPLPLPGIKPFTLAFSPEAGRLKPAPSQPLPRLGSWLSLGSLPTYSKVQPPGKMSNTHCQASLPGHSKTQPPTGRPPHGTVHCTWEDRQGHVKKGQRGVSSCVKLPEYPLSQVALSSHLERALSPPPAVLIFSLVPVCSSPNMDRAPPTR